MLAVFSYLVFASFVESLYRIDSDFAAFLPWVSRGNAGKKLRQGGGR